MAKTPRYKKPAPRRPSTKATPERPANGYLSPNPTGTPQGTTYAPRDPFVAEPIEVANARNYANTAWKNTLADSVSDEGTFASGIGATLGPRDPNADPSTVTTGTIDWNTVQANNPFSQAGLLQRSYDQQKNRTTNSYAAAGQLYSGAIQNARSEDTFGYQKGQDALTKALNEYLTGQSRNRRDAGVNRDVSVNDAALAALSGRLRSNPY